MDDQHNEEYYITASQAKKTGQFIEAKSETGDVIRIKIEGNSFPLKSASKKINCRDEPKPIKPPLSTQNLLNQLEKRGISVPENQKEKALSVLRQINYYRLAVFSRYLPADKNDFNSLMEIYNFDRFLRNKITILLNPVELLIRTSLAHYLACLADEKATSPYPPGLIYLDKSLYKEELKDSDYERMISSLYDSLAGNVDREQSLIHYGSMKNPVGFRVSGRSAS